MQKLSDTALSIITLLHNINELITRSSDRKSAKEVLSAVRVYAKNKRFTMPEDKMDNFFSVLLDARPLTLTTILKDIAEDVVSFDKKNNKPQIKKNAV